MKLPQIFLIVLQLNFLENANILGIAPLNAKSHFVMFEALFKGLAAKGHNVDVVGHFPLKEKVARYNDLPIKGFPNLVNNMTVDFVVNKNILSLMELIMHVAGPGLCKAVLETDTLKNLRNTTKRYDLLITEFFGTDCMLGFSHLYKIPTVAITTNVILPWSSSFIGLPDNPSYIPTCITPFKPTMSFSERAINTAVYIMTKIMYDLFSMADSNIFAKEFFGSDLPDLRDLVRRVSLLLVNSHFSAHISRPSVPNFVEVAGLHINESINLPKHFQDALRTDLKGVIYLSFGSMLLTESFPEYKLRALFEAFGKVPYKIMWKATREKFSKNLDIPSNIQFETWMPQMGILCHPNVKLFVSHGGMMGTLEALYCGVPVLGIPIFADQMLNIETSASRGFAVQVNYNNISEESISTALMMLLEDASYQENVKNASKLFKDRPISAMDTAIYWIEYVIRHNGAPHLRTIGADLAWYQYFLVDVALVFLTIIIILMIIMYYTLIYMYNFIFKQVTKIKQQ